MVSSHLFFLAAQQMSGLSSRSQAKDLSNHQGARRPCFSDPQYEDSSMDGPLNDTMNGQSNIVDDDDDLQPQYKYLSPVEKRRDVMKKQRKIDDLSSKKQVAEHSYETTNLDSSTRTPINISSQMEQDDYTEREDLPAHYKYNCTKDKVVAKETSATPSNFEAYHYQNKISTRPSAIVSASKHHYGTTNWSSGNSMKRWKNQNKTVAMGKLVSCDPTQKLDGVPLGKEFWMVAVCLAMVHDEPLIRPYKGYKVLRDVEGGVYVAWPSTFIQKIDI